MPPARVPTPWIVQSEVSRVQAAVASNTTALQFTNEKIDKLDSRVDEGFAKLADAMDKQAAMQAEAMAKQAAMQAEAMAKQAAMQAEAMAKQADAITKLQRSIDQLPLAALKSFAALALGLATFFSLAWPSLVQLLRTWLASG